MRAHVLAIGIAGAFLPILPALVHAQTSDRPRVCWTRPAALSLDGKELWVVNADHDSVTALEVLDSSPYLRKVCEIPVGRKPRTLAFSPDGGQVFVANQLSSSIAVIDRRKKMVVAFAGTGWGSQPYGVVVSPCGQFAYVSLYAAAKVAKFDTAAFTTPQTIAVPEKPWAMALTADGKRLFVTQVVNGGPYLGGDPGLVTRIDTESLQTTAIPLARDPTPDTGGYVTMLHAVAITPDNRRAIVVCQHANSDRGMFRDGRASLSFKTEVQAVLCLLDLESERELFDSRLVLSRMGSVISSPRAVEPVERGNDLYLLIAAQGSEDVKVVKYAEEGRVLERALIRVGTQSAEWPSGAAPNGIVADAARDRIYVHNYLNRTMSVIPVVSPLEIREEAEIVLTEREVLSATVLRGKKVFYSSEMGVSRDSWMSCATCHADGYGTDGRTWDFSQFGDQRSGIVQNVSLLGAAVRTGALFWFGRADEVQDLESGVRKIFGGRLIAGEPNDYFGQPNAGLSSDFDAVAAYVHSLDRVPPSPFRRADGTLSDSAVRGRRIFYGAAGCATCHPPETRFTDSTTGLAPGKYIKYDVGTSDRLSGPEGAQGYDVPTLTGVWETGPWLHDGRAETMRHVLRDSNVNDQHGTTSGLSDRETDDLAVFVLSIDEGGDVRSADGRTGTNEPPVAAAGNTAQSLRVKAGEPAAFLGSRSLDRDGHIVSWEWNFRDGTDSERVDARSTCGDVIHVFPNRDGTYLVTLKVTDDQGAWSARSWYVGVGGEAQPERVYRAALPGEAVGGSGEAQR